MVKDNIIGILSSVFIAALFCPHPACALTEAEELKRARDTSSYINASILQPALQASGGDHGDRAVVLYARAIDLWQQEHFVSKNALALQAKETAEILRSQAWLYANLNRPVEEGEAYEQLARKPTLLSGTDKEWTLDCLIHAGRAFQEAKQYDRALAIYQSVIGDDPGVESIGARVGLSEAYASQGHLRKAEDVLNDMLATKVFVTSPLDLRRVRIALKDFYAGQRRLEDASKIEALLNDKRCPKCGLAKSVVPIAFGLLGPHPDSAPRVHPGGCGVVPWSPAWYCEGDDTSF